MPEERARIEVDRLAALLLCPDERSAATLRAEGVGGRAEVVGDVMADATLRFAPIARERVPPPHPPGTYVVATVHREANVRPEQASANRRRALTARRARRLPRASADHRGSGRRDDPSRGERGAPRAARLPRLRLGGVPGSRDRDRLGRAPEGGLLVRRPVRDDASFDGVGGHGRDRRECARGRRSGTYRGGRPDGGLPGRTPPLYGDGQASARIAAALHSL